jgi:hypothetical protein
MFAFVKMTDIQRLGRTSYGSTLTTPPAKTDVGSLTEDHKYIVVALLCKYITIFNTSHEDPVELAILTNNMIEAINAP